MRAPRGRVRQGREGAGCAPACELPAPPPHWAGAPRTLRLPEQRRGRPSPFPGSLGAHSQASLRVFLGREGRPEFGRGPPGMGAGHGAVSVDGPWKKSGWAAAPDGYDTQVGPREDWDRPLCGRVPCLPTALELRGPGAAPGSPAGDSVSFQFIGLTTKAESGAATGTGGLGGAGSCGSGWTGGSEGGH